MRIRMIHICVMRKPLRPRPGLLVAPLAGFDVELATSICKEAGYKCRFVVLPTTADRIPALQVSA